LLMQQYLPKSAQNCLKLPKTTKICPNTISSRNIEIPPKIEIWVFFKKMYRGGTKASTHHLDFNLRTFYMPFTMSKKRPLHVNFSIPLCAK
jgi:hypothetical protein